MKFQERIESEIISVAAGGLRQPPVDLSQVARDIGVVGVHRISCRDAFTHFQPTGPVIYLSEAVYGTRMRFIIAHELAHIMLRNHAVVEWIERSGQVGLVDDEEGLANRVAGTLLLPDSWVEAIGGTRLTVEGLKEIARMAGMPIPMLITRLATAGIDIALLHWQRGRRSWHVVDRPGTPFFLHGYVEPSESGTRAIDHLGSAESEIIIDCDINGSRVRIGGRGYRHGSRGEQALQFLAPARDVWFLDAMGHYRKLG